MSETHPTNPNDPKKSHHKPKALVTLKTGQPVSAPPDYLGPIGKICYNKCIQDLRDMGIADRADSAAIEAYSAAYEEYRIARKVCMDKGFTQDHQALDEQGKVYVEKTTKRPEAEVMANAWARMKTLLTELYLTPATRTKVPGSGKATEGSDWDDLIPDAK